jgi:hypothetical protein
MGDHLKIVARKPGAFPFSGSDDDMERALQIAVSEQASGRKPEQDHLPRLAYSASEAAAALGVSTKSLYRLRDRGLIHASKALRHLRFTAEELRRFLNDTTR